MLYKTSVLMTILCSLSFNVVYSFTVGEFKSKSVLPLIEYIITSHDVVLDIDSPGGNMSAELMVNSAIVLYRPTLICNVNKFAASMATWLVFDTCRKNGSVNIADNAIFVFHYTYHSYLGGFLPIPFMGKEREIIREYYADIFSDVLTQEELDSMYYHNVDIKLTGSVIKKRLAKQL